MASGYENHSLQSFRLFSSSDQSTNSGLGFVFGFSDSVEASLPPPPPCLEVLRSEASSYVKYTVEPVKLDEITLLKLGCGHGLPGIFACLEGASSVHFQDFNAEVLRCLTIPNVNANLAKKSQPSSKDMKCCEIGEELRFFAGDWSEIDKILPLLSHIDNDSNFSSGHIPVSGYDVILMAETVYSISVLGNLYELIKKCLSRPHGLVYMAAKKHYFGVGGGTRRFLSLVEKDGLMAFTMVAEVADGSSNVREVWKLSFK